jgi:hypothetical protein
MLCSMQQQQQQQQQQQRVTVCEVWACDSSYVPCDRERKAKGVVDGSASDNHEAVTFLKQVQLQLQREVLRIRVSRCVQDFMRAVSRADLAS